MTRYCGRCLSTFESDPGACPNLACKSPRPSEGWGVVLGEGDILDRRYRVERCLAVGGAGLTYLAQELTDGGEPQGPRLAVKVLYNARASGPFLKRLSTEAQILQDLAHDNIVELRGFVQRAGQEPYLVTRFEEGGSLAQHIERTGPLSPRVAAGVLRQVLLGLDVAHQRGVVHRDLKPDNVLLSESVSVDVVPKVRVADFGIAKIASGGVGERLTRTGAFVGTPEFAAPEQFEGQNPTAATDVFAAGALFVYLLTGAPPFTFTHRADIASSYEELLGQLPLKLPAGIADLATQTLLQSVVDQTLQLAPEHRPTVQRTLSLLAPLLDQRSSRPDTLDVSVATTKPRAGLPPTVDEEPFEPLESPESLDPRRIEPTIPDGDPPIVPIGKLSIGDGVPQPPPTIVGPADAEPDTAQPPAGPRTASETEFFPTEPARQALSQGADANEPDTTWSDEVPAPGETLLPEGLDGSPEPPPMQGDLPPPPLPSLHGDLESAVTEASQAIPRPASALPPPLPRDVPPPPPIASQSPPPLPPPSAEQTPKLAEPKRPGPQGPKLADPPPFAPSLPPVEPEEPPQMPVVQPQPRRGGFMGLAGCAGLSFFSMGAIGLGGLAFIGLLLVVFAGATGWIGGATPPKPVPVVVTDPAQAELRAAPSLSASDAKKVQRSIKEAKGDLTQRCGTGAVVAADVLVEPTGRIAYALVARTSELGKLDPVCLEQAIERVKVRGGVSSKGKTHVEIIL